jgi:signal transduction histidine kinase
MNTANTFQTARLRLTVWYVIISLFLNIFFSIGIYFGITRGANPPWSHPQTRYRFGPPRQFNDHHLIFIIVLVHGIIFIISVGAGYFLAGKTLREIKEMMDEQNRFITGASHELKTPITALRTQFEAALLDEKTLDLKKAKSLIKSGHEEIINLQNLAENLLELSHVHNQQGALKMERLSLLDIIETALKRVVLLAKQKRITINTSEINDYQLYGERQRLIELFVILLDNAIKYSPQDSGVAILSRKTDRSLIIQVKDTGIGIRKKDLQHIFDTFYRTDTSRSQTRGFGLGLSIAKEIVTAHKGTIDVTSTHGSGTTFTVRLPSGKTA